MAIYSSRSTPPTFNPSDVMATPFSMFWKKAAPGGRYHISLPGFPHSDESNMSTVGCSMGGAGVEGLRPEADPEG
ncbi:hypothetical protein HYQ46_011601 [Verticillium longisporum]|nr:hypothetical protein HYQ46_011601 [Verticillium longisporum]